MKLAAACALLALVACTSPAPTRGVISPTATSTPSQLSNPPSAGHVDTPTPSSATLTTSFNCGVKVNVVHGLALFELSSVPLIEVLDVSNPLRPHLLCTLGPARGGRFLSATTIAFWIDDMLGTADLVSGRVFETSRLRAVAWFGSFSRDGSKFAYRSGSDTDTGMTLHLHTGAGDRVIYAQEPIGGHGGPGWGPVNQLAFSPDGSELLDYYLFRPGTGPDALQVFRADGSQLFHSRTAAFGAWSADGSRLYYFVMSPNLSGELDSIDADGRTATVANLLNGFYWPTASPDGGVLLYTGYDASGMPHVWRVILPQGTASQLMTQMTSRAVFVNPNVIWVDEEKPCECGPGGVSAPDGVILAHDFAGPSTGVVDMTETVPGIGPKLPQPTTDDLMDIWP